MTQGPNTKFKADIVLYNSRDGYHAVWIHDDVNARVLDASLSLLILGAAKLGRSVYDGESGKWIVGDVGQLDDVVSV